MAWRALMRKGLNSSFIANCRTTKCSSDSINRIPNILLHSGLEGNTNCPNFKNRLFFRNYHASLGLLSWQKGRAEESQGLKSRRVKKPKRESNTKTQIPVEAKYIAPKLKLKSKPAQEKTIEIFEGISLVELSKRAGKPVKSLQEILINVGEKVNSEFDPISIDVAELISMEVGLNVKRLHSSLSSSLHPRPPVITVMGHVDHGKTSLLDALRKTSLASLEAGGITQHLGAFVVKMQGGEMITFLDTPGHAAFREMRARGAKVTDIVVLVVAADDGVMPQTLEAIEHARSANVPVVVAINKCDKPGSNPERVKIQLGSEGLLLEDLGGDVQVVEISALKNLNLDKLEEALLLQAELMDLKARVTGPALAYVVEARVDRGKGPLVTAIVKEGELSLGNYVVVGSEWGRVRNMRDMNGKSEKVIKPAIPVEIEGLKGLPMAGEEIIVVGSEERARMLSQGRKKKMERERLEMREREREGEREEEEREEETEEGEEREKVERRELAIVVKGDVQGTVQAVSDALRSLNSPQVFVNIVHVGVGPISQSDIDMARACNACIVGFNIRNLPSSISQAANQANIKIFLHKVIYHLLEALGKLIVETAPGTAETQVSGEAEILSIFASKSKKSKDLDVKIAGLRVTDGRFTKTGTMRLLRSGEVVYEGSCGSLRREKQDVETVGKGNECGLVIEGCLEFRVGDVVQCLESVVRKPKFVSTESGAVRIEC